MKYVHTTVHVKDMEKSVAFYRDILGLKVLASFEGGQGTRITFLGDPESETHIELIGGTEHTYHGKGITLGFGVKDVDKQMQLIEILGLEHSPMREPKPNVKFFFIKDPDGLSIQFIQE